MNKSLLGYTIKSNSDIHICGYKDNRVIYQVNGKTHKSSINANNKGCYFNLKGKKIYLP